MVTITKSFNAVRIDLMIILPTLSGGAPVLDTNNNPSWNVQGKYSVIGPSGEVLPRQKPVALTATEQLTLDTFMAAKLAAVAVIEGVA